MLVSLSSTPLHDSPCLRRRLNASSTSAEKAMPSLAAASSASARREASMVTHFALFTDAQGGRGINRGDVKPARSITPHYRAADLYYAVVKRDVTDPAYYIMPQLGGTLWRAVLYCAVVERNITDAPLCITAWRESGVLYCGVTRSAAGRP